MLLLCCSLHCVYIVNTLMDVELKISNDLQTINGFKDADINHMPYVAFKSSLNNFFHIKAIARRNHFFLLLEDISACSTPLSAL